MSDTYDLEVVRDFLRATRALALELPGPVYDDYSKRVEAVLALLEPRAVTAKAVLDRAYRAWLENDEDVTEMLASVGREFGVTS